MVKNSAEILSCGPLRVRVTPSQMHRLKAGAEMEGIPFADFVRGVLDQGLGIREELTNLRRLIVAHDDSPASPVVAGADHMTHAVAVETLLLIRQLVRPENLRAVRADLSRLGLTPFPSTRP
ncbi:hypothetical protein [Castellaniella sp. UC4442_H9]